MSLKIKLEKPVNDYSGGGKPFVQPFHAYKARITKVEESDKGWINVDIETIDAKSGQYDSLSVKSDSQYLVATVGKWANAIVRSNAQLASAGANTEIDMSKWVGLEIGIVYQPQQEKVGEQWVDGKFSTPHFAIPTSEVEDWDVDTVKYEAWRAKFWAKDDGAKPATPTETPASTLPVDTELPF